MTEVEQNFVKESMREILDNHNDVIREKFNTINVKLDNITQQTTKTNGRVGMLEVKTENLALENQKHFIECPVSPRVSRLEEESISFKGIKKFVIGAITILGIIMGVVFGIVSLIK